MKKLFLLILLLPIVTIANPISTKLTAFQNIPTLSPAAVVITNHNKPASLIKHQVSLSADKTALSEQVEVERDLMEEQREQAKRRRKGNQERAMSRPF